MSKVREAVGRVRGLPMSAFAALAHGSRRVRDNALAYVAMQPDVDADVSLSVAVSRRVLARARLGGRAGLAWLARPPFWFSVVFWARFLFPKSGFLLFSSNCF